MNGQVYPPMRRDGTRPAGKNPNGRPAGFNWPCVLLAAAVLCAAGCTNAQKDSAPPAGEAVAAKPTIGEPRPAGNPPCTPAGLPAEAVGEELKRGLAEWEKGDFDAAQLEEEIRSRYPDAIGHNGSFLLPRAAGAARNRDDQTMCWAATIHPA